MAKALYRQYRPKTFDEVLGQDKVVNVLKNQVKNNNFSHAYLFAGERGCGKTSCAKIFAKAINCLNPKDGSPCLECENCKTIDEETSLDVVEMDAASNRRIDDIRNLKDNVIYPPSELKYKVYIIDEAHMITREAFNALLKIMEEPPKHLVFILATTEIDKIPKTILSRVQKFEFNKIYSDKIKAQINIILNDLGVDMENEAIDLIIRKAGGAMRDALSILDQVLSFDKDSFTLSDLESILGTVDFSVLDKLVDAIGSKDQKQGLGLLNSIRESGKSNQDILDSLINYYRDMMVLKVGVSKKSFENEERLKLIEEKTDKFDLSRILTSLDVLNDYENKLRFSTNTDILLDVLILRLIDTVDIENLDSRISKLERNTKSNIVDLVNNLIDRRLAGLKLSDIVQEAKDEPIKKINQNEEVIKEKPPEEVPSENLSNNSEIARSESEDLKSYKLDEASEEEIKNMIINTSGTMLRALFNDEGFNYRLYENSFNLYIKDEFYRIFIDTKAEDIEKNISEILNKDISFKLRSISELGSEAYETKHEGTDESPDDIKKNDRQETISKLKEIFSDALIIK